MNKMKAFIHDQAQRIADAIKNQRRVETVENQVQNILEEIASSGSVPKIAPGSVDEDLYDELLSLGVIKRSNSSSSSATSRARSSKSPQQHVNNRFVPPTSTDAADFSNQSTIELNALMTHNNERLRELTLQLEDDDMEDERRKKLEVENAKLVATQRKIWWIIDTRNKQAGVPTNKKRQQPPAQTPIYKEAKRIKRVEFPDDGEEPEAKRRYKANIEDESKEDGEIVAGGADEQSSGGLYDGEEK